MPKYHLDCGNSSTGPIGLCGVIEAASKEEALQKFKDSIPDELEIKDRCFGEEDIEYMNVYFGVENIKIEEIEEEEE